MRLDTNFYQQDTLTVAQELIGKVLVRELDNKKIKSKIVETEAYIGPYDKACHAYQNKKTKRTKAMFAPGGYTYVYQIYGIHYCFNIVTSKENNPEAVLIRAIEPLTALEVIEKRRQIKSNRSADLTNGPGKLCQALEIDKSLNNYDLTSGEKIYVIDEGKSCEVVSAKRINIDYAEEYKDKLWRFYIPNNPFVSK
ncbi:DNA-3-methyladenine glycosylase [Halobacteroides halobius DSM 5150]|uniref:Putative 3-methyladenine DNA glycosylase n=1 Tax=Halobacteroides halobius (strain ATCC 35273 / DSM 5150 / MD-1) TaxID=748449 RepID=L0KB85_HALHC|nr:DNA-3-methyladenine glycosylase [Halobacteroides halobius]AGB41333.1 DNA-3-methyladenine glycosylase [Halobacteroides halobius DSM 5150]